MARLIITSGVGSGISGAPGVSGASAPPAPNVTTATAAATYQLFGNASSFGFAGTITLPTSDPNYSHLKTINMYAFGPGTNPSGDLLATFTAPFTGASIAYSAGNYLQTTSSSVWSFQIVCVNEVGAPTSGPLGLTGVVVAPIGAGAPTPAIPPGEFTPGTPLPTWQDTNGSIVLSVALPVTPPSPIGTVIGGHVYAEIPDGSGVTGIAIGTWVLGDGSGLTGAWNPIDTGRYVYSAANQPWKILLDPGKYQFVPGDSIRLIVKAYSSQVDDVPIQNGQPNASPSVVFTVPTYASSKPGSATQYAPLVKGITATVLPAESISGKLERPIAVTVDISNFSDPPPTGFAYYIIGIYDEDTNQTQNVMAGPSNVNGLTPSLSDGISAPHSFVIDEPAFLRGIDLYCVSAQLARSPVPVSDAGHHGASHSTLQYLQNPIVPGLTPFVHVNIGTNTGVIDVSAYRHGTRLPGHGVQLGPGVNVDAGDDVVVQTGAGASLDGAGNLIVNTGGAISIDGSNNVVVATGSGITQVGNQVVISLAATPGMKLNGAEQLLLQTAAGVTVDGSGNLVVTPGPGVTFSGNNVVVRAGTASGVTIDGSGNVVVKAGTSNGVTFDGSGNVILKTSLGGIKFDGSGNAIVQAGAGASLNGSGDLVVNVGGAVSIDGSNNVIVSTGSGITQSGGKVVISLAATPGMKLNGAEQLLLQTAAGVTVDGSGNLVVTPGPGITFSGSNIIVNPGTASGITVDGTGHVIVKTTFSNGVAFDGSGNVLLKTGLGGVKLDGGGNVILQVNGFGGLGVDAFGNAIAKVGQGMQYDSGGNLKTKVDGSTLQFDAFGNQILGTVGLTNFGSGARSVGIVFSLPALPDSTHYPQGSIIMNTADGKLYRTSTGSAWDATADPRDLTAHALAAGVVYAGAVGVNQLVAGTATFTGDVTLVRSGSSSQVVLSSTGISLVSGTGSAGMALNTSGQGTFTNTSGTSTVVNGNAVSTGSVDAASAALSVSPLKYSNAFLFSPTASAGTGTLPSGPVKFALFLDHTGTAFKIPLYNL